MASAAFEDFLTCSICLEIFKDPVSLGCQHNFCYNCITIFWENLETKACPVCRRRSSKEGLYVNFALKELSISFNEEQRAKAREDEVLCLEHPDMKPMFCKDEEIAFCPVCEQNEHKNHTLETVEKLKEHIETKLKRLKERREEVIEEEKLFEDIRQYSEKQEKDSKQQIIALFERLQQFLTNEQERALSQLRQEQQRQARIIGPELHRVRGHLSSLSQRIQALERQLQRGTNTFATRYNQTLRHAKMPQASQQLKQTGLLLNQAEILGNLGFKVWERMRCMVQQTPVILDPNTANKRLALTDCLTSVGECAEQEVPLNSERFANMAAVLGSQGFSSGKHQWEVEVGDHPHWVIGVAKESVEKEEKISIMPEYGIWCLWHGNGGYTNGCNRPVPVKKRPERIRVKLNFDSGKVSFYDMDDETLLYTHKDNFTERLFPVFAVGTAGDATTKQLRICHYVVH